MQDPLSISIPLSGVETDYPLLPAGDYALQVKESEAVPNKDNSAWQWKLVLETTSPITAIDGREIKVGTKLFSFLPLAAKPDSKDPDWWMRNLCSTIDGLLGTNKDNRPNFDGSIVQRALGIQVVCAVKVDTFEGRTSNKIQTFKHPVA